MTYKVCVQCGKNLPISMYRPYGQGRKASHKRCKPCESLNLRFKYLMRKDKLTDKETNEVNAIMGIYTALDKLGHEIPISKVANEQRIKEYELHIKNIKKEILSKADKNEELPKELLYWLNTPLLNKPPEYYLDIVYEELQDKYAPILRYNSETSLPERDDIYKESLHAILERFYEYEEKYGGEYNG